MPMTPYTAAYWGSSLLHKSVVMPVVITDIAEWIIQQDCRHMCSETLPTPCPYSFLLFYSLRHGLIHQTSSSSCSSCECGSVRHIHILCIFTALALIYCTKHHHKRMCVWRRGRHQISLKQVLWLSFLSTETHTWADGPLIDTHTIWVKLVCFYEMLMIFKCIQCDASVQAALRGSHSHIWTRGSNTSCHALNATKMNRFHSANKERDCVCVCVPVWLMYIAVLWGFI